MKLSVVFAAVSCVLLSRLSSAQDDSCALIGEDCYLSGLDCCDPFHDCNEGYCDITYFSPAHGQTCGEDCGNTDCSLTAEECTDGICLPSPDSECADLGAECSNFVPCCSGDHDCIALDYEGNFRREGYCEVAKSGTGEACSGDDDCRFQYDICVDDVCKVSPSVQIDVSERTTVSVRASAYDTRPAGENGCGTEGCLPELTRDGVIDPDSRWSCSKGLGEGACSLVFELETPQDVLSMNIAFHKGDERQRKIKVFGDGESLGVFTSSGTTLEFENWTLNAKGVSKIRLAPRNLDDDEWLSITEVELLNLRYYGSTSC